MAPFSPRTLTAAAGPKPSSVPLRRALDASQHPWWTPLERGGAEGRAQDFGAFVQERARAAGGIEGGARGGRVVLLQPLERAAAEDAPLEEAARFLSHFLGGVRVVTRPPLAPADTRFLRRGAGDAVLCDDIANLMARRTDETVLFALVVTAAGGGAGVRADARVAVVPVPRNHEQQGQPQQQQQHQRRASNPFSRDGSAAPPPARANPFEQRQQRPRADELCSALCRAALGMLGVAPCVYYRCVANSPRQPGGVLLHACPVCLRKLHHALGFDVVKRYRGMLAAARGAGLRDEVAWLSERVEELTLYG